MFRGRRSELIAVQQLKTKHEAVKKAVLEGRDPSQLINSVRFQLHSIGCSDLITKAIIKKSNILLNWTLHEISNPAEYSISVPYSAELQSDADQLYQKWFKGDVNGELLRGIKPSMGTTKNTKKQTVSYRSYDLEPEYSKKASKFMGEGHLKNGDWWPLQIAAVRDGAHGESIAGISGAKDQGAFSVVMNMATEEESVDPTKIDPTFNKYPNFDLPEKGQIWYCGTQGKETQTGHAGSQSAATELLQMSHKNHHPIRVIRGCKIKSRLAPAKGLRYDGLYGIIDAVCICQELAIWIFLLERLSGQMPIRYQGPDARPHEEELRKWNNLQAMMSEHKRD